MYVVAPESTPLERVMGQALAVFVRNFHEQQGVRFHLDATAVAFDGDRVTRPTGRAWMRTSWCWGSTCDLGGNWRSKPDWRPAAQSAEGLACLSREARRQAAQTPV